MQELLGGMKNITICDTVVTIKSAMKEADKEKIVTMLEELQGMR